MLECGMQVSVDIPLVALPDGVHSTMFKGDRRAPSSVPPSPAPPRPEPSGPQTSQPPVPPALHLHAACGQIRRADEPAPLCKLSGRCCPAPLAGLQSPWQSRNHQTHQHLEMQQG